MGLINRVMKRFRGSGTRLATSQQSQIPAFERLEPRILLSADAGLVHDYSFVETPQEQAISIEFEPDLGARSQITDQGGQTSENGLEGRKVGSEEEKEGTGQSKAPDLPGLQLVEPGISPWQGQTVYLDFDGAQEVVYDGPVTVGPFDVPAFSLKGTELHGNDQVVISGILSGLEKTFAGTGVVFTTEQPTTDELYSTVYIGGDDSPFAEYGEFLGLAEQVDVGNLDMADQAFVFSDGIRLKHSASSAAEQLADIIAHEVAHLLGYGHSHESESELSLLSGVASATVAGLSPADNATGVPTTANLGITLTNPSKRAPVLSQSTLPATTPWLRVSM